MDPRPEGPGMWIRNRGQGKGQGRVLSLGQEFLNLIKFVRDIKL